MKLLSSIVINLIGILIILVPLWLIGRKNTSISMKPFKDGFYTYAWAFESNKLKLLHSSTYAKGSLIGTPQGQRFEIKDVSSSKFLFGFQERFDFVTERVQ
ncbi:hypothetical protein [Companilactobacillus halodurans]|uniref:Uncharacterized protein n=1 Tax=Companilactobacillus halodurans TaxID=2584183 RepID=A0A5P0ZTY5_9LACO|nr:hypothetical protein [Companilactobacillus halodurans]MQS76004.1 hypothetical protein [Companilactobacillus halodurans]MQS96440.1 hypothetical protein [Companilactobacillus halodurans]